MLRIFRFCVLLAGLFIVPTLQPWNEYRDAPASRAVGAVLKRSHAERGNDKSAGALGEGAVTRPTGRREYVPVGSTAAFPAADACRSSNRTLLGTGISVVLTQSVGTIKFI